MYCCLMKSSFYIIYRYLARTNIIFYYIVTQQCTSLTSFYTPHLQIYQWQTLMFWIPKYRTHWPYQWHRTFVQVGVNCEYSDVLDSPGKTKLKVSDCKVLLTLHPDPIQDKTVTQSYIFWQDLLETIIMEEQDMLCSDQRTYNYPDNLEQELRQD